MTIKTQVHTCRKCQSEDLVKNGTNASGSPLYHCKTCGTYGVLEPKQRYSEEEKEIIIKAYQERASMRGIERIHGVCRQTLSAWLKKRRMSSLLLKRRYNLLIRNKYLCWRWMSYGPLYSVEKTKFGSGLH